MDKYDKQARQESHLDRQGSDWIVSTWDDAVRCYRTSPGLPYSTARQDLADWRDQRAQKLRVSAAFSALGKLGARASSKVMTPAKIAASRANGKLGGRPRKAPAPVSAMHEEA